jgi:hypothetical protein
MNHLTLCFLSILLFPAAGVQVTWLTPTEHDFGDLLQGKPVQVEFRYRNDGAAPLVIDNVRPSCGCTTPGWPEEPLPPDSSATILVAFNARNAGYFRKLIKVYFQGQRRAERLYVEGFVVKN